MCSTSSSQVKSIIFFSKSGFAIGLKTLQMMERGRNPNKEKREQSGIIRQIVLVIKIFYSLVLALVSNSPAHRVLLIKT